MLNRMLTAAALGVVLLFGGAASADALPATQPAAAKPAADSPDRVVVFEVDGPWAFSGWSDINNTVDRLSTWEVRDKVPHFTIGDVQSVRVWLHYLALPISLERYPIMVLRYRAVRLGGGWYNIWLDGGAGPSGGGPAGGVICAVGMNELKSDGEVQEVRMNLRERGLTSPTLIGIANGLGTKDDRDGSYDLISLRFEALPDAKPAPLADDAPREAEVVDDDGQPVAGARVIIDAERRNFARTGETNQAGLAKVTPLTNETNKHMVRVEADGFVTIEQKDIGQELKLRFMLKRRAVIGGVVRNDKGEPVSGAVVLLQMPQSLEAMGPMAPASQRLFRVPTDANGQWSIAGAPASLDRFTLTYLHADYLVRNDQVQKFTPEMAKFRQSKGEATLTRAVSVVGTVFDSKGKPVAGALVTCGRGMPRASTGKDGQFTLRGITPDSSLTVIVFIAGKEAARMNTVAKSEPEALTLTVE